MDASPVLGLTAVIPALNEAATIEQVVRNVLTVAEKVIVVDDGSQDGTGVIAKNAGALIVRHNAPQGYDAAIAAGLNEAFQLGAKAAVTCDADGQHLPEDVFLVGNTVLKDHLDFCGGIRDHYNRPIEAVAGVIAQALWGTSDPFCGLKCYANTIYEKFGPFPTELNIGTLPLVWLKSGDLRFRFLPIHTQKRLDQPRFGPFIRSNIKLGLAMGKSIKNHLSSSRKL